MVYPYLINDGNDLKKKLIQNKVFVATYWPNVLELSESDSFEYILTNNVLAIPIDQRLNTKDLYRILRIINKYHNE